MFVFNCADASHRFQEWGHDFRMEYRRLGTFRDRFPDVAIMALTASATPASVFLCYMPSFSLCQRCFASVQDDIVQSLKMSKDHLFKVVHPFNRFNLFYEVSNKPSSSDHLSLSPYDLGSIYIQPRPERSAGGHLQLHIDTPSKTKFSFYWHHILSRSGKL